MSWVGETGFAPRPLVLVEDHLLHVAELLAALAALAPDTAALPAQLTVVCLDRRGPDTDRAVAQWLADYPGLQVAAATDGGDGGDSGGERFAPLAPAVFDSAPLLCRAVASMLRPGGLLLQDVQLSTLRFIPAERWWESIYLASTVRGMFSGNPPTCRFLSNKRGYEATFGRDLLGAGFDPRDVIDKRDLALVVPVVRSFFDRAFPWTLCRAAGGTRLSDVAVGRGESDRAEIEGELDLVLWSGEQGIELSGRLLPEGRRLALRAGSHEATTWCELVADRLAGNAGDGGGGGGVPVIEVGRRLAPEGADRAELTNVAARHLHVLRGRLADASAIVTAHHAYRLSDRLAVGRVSSRGVSTP